MKPILFNAPMVRAILAGRKTQTRRVISSKSANAIREMEGDEHSPLKFAFMPPRDDDGTSGKPQWCCYLEDYPEDGVFPIGLCPLGQPGDRLWVREAWCIGAWQLWSEAVAIDYRADSFCRREWIRIGDDDGGEAFDKYLKQSIADAKAAGLSADEDGYYHWKAGESPCRWRPSIHMPRWASRITLEVTDVRVQRLQDISEEDAIAEGVVCPRLGTYGMKPETVFRDLWDSIAKPGAKWDDNPWVWAVTFKLVEVCNA